MNKKIRKQEMPELILPDRRYLESVKNAVREYTAFPSPFDINCVHKLIDAAKTDFQTYFDEIENARNSLNLPEGHVPSTALWLVENGCYAGSFDIRHYLNDFLQKRGGHIAYQIVPSKRGNALAAKGLRLALDYCRTNLRLDKVLLTCNFENAASYKTMTAVMNEYGGYEDTPSETDGSREHRVWIMTAAKAEALK